TPQTPHRADALRRGPHIFDPAAFAWATERVRRALDGGPALVIIDEIGPIELEMGGGFAPLLGPVANCAVPALLVVRQSLRQALAQRLGQPPAVFWVTESTRERLPQDILAALLGRRVNRPAPA
ncbi:MAG: nucleoside-triphosphatase, partial [Anaerolineae bacterium]|nr:nucleoside-triphosphatase [Anaerolineae bacterium]